MCVKAWGIQSACVEHVADTNLYQDHTGASMEATTTVPYKSLNLNTQLATRLCLLAGCEKKM